MLCKARWCALSSVVFAVYWDGLLEELADCGCGCYWHNLFAGAFCYADDIVLLAPCDSALRVMLNICCSYASILMVSSLILKSPS